MAGSLLLRAAQCKPDAPFVIHHMYNASASTANHAEAEEALLTLGYAQAGWLSFVESTQLDAQMHFVSFNYP